VSVDCSVESPLSEWGAALFAGLLSLLGLFGLRRRP
jgi:MYXO-CTERM domain-containing protein